MRTLPILLLATAVLAHEPSPSPRSYKPHPSPYRMANMAERIVEGRLGDGGKVSISKDYFTAPGVERTAAVMVPALVGMSRKPFDFGLKHPAIDTDQVLLFLRRTAGEGGEWEPLHLLEGAARGVIWFKGAAVWGYGQMINPGPYVLGRWNEPSVPGAEPALAGADEIRAQVAAGLVARRAWGKVLAMPDGDDKAAAIARWLSPSTSPDGVRYFERFWPDLQQAARAQGAAMVRPLARLVATDRDASAIGYAVRVLIDLAPASRRAAPMFIGRLRDLRGAHAIDLLRGLTRFGDAAAIPVLRDYLAVDDLYIAATAGRALHRCGDAEAATRITARVPPYIDGDHPVSGVAELLDVLHDIDAKAAEDMVRARFMDEPELLQMREWLRRMRR